ncbi:alpha/beta fold hydrolase [Vibrio splendidus]|uniref:Alpha/beta fold hydrolase n=1 Tax=Vibrio splendidus TaxID=29497 RepID=A0A7Y4G2A7_VIBSP|nr:alpha/beta fold hydrolase [Vibrio splendidus]NOJ14044.1 alpha/beta fold hydrolase [Vibrio splendidus]
MTTPVKCESYEGAVLKDFNKPYICGLITLALLGCQSEDSTQEPVSVLVPYNLNELPKPNDGYGYDEDGTISGIGEDAVAMLSANDAYYQDYNNSYAALDGWGLCAEPILIPLQSVNSDKRYPLDNNSLLNNVVLIDESGELVATRVEADGSNIKIQCEASLKPHELYSVVVTDGVKTEFGESLQAAQSFNDLLYSGVPLESERDIELQKQVLSAMDAYYKHFPEQGVPVYAAQFTTQSAYSTLDAMRDNHISEGTTFLRELILVEDKTTKYDLYTQKLKLPFYLPFTESREAECNYDQYEPKASCPPLYEWMKTGSGGFPTGDDPLPIVVESQIINADIYTPVRWDGIEQLPTVVFVHGVTADKSAASLMAKDYTTQGFAVVAIDMPYHGERMRYDLNGVEISAKANKSFFINIDSPLALRSNLQQSVSDFLGLRFALNGQPWVDKKNIHLVGHSLGGIMSVMVSEFSQDSPLFGFKTVNFVVPGQGLTNLTLTSQTLGPEMSEGVKKSPDVQRSIAETVVPESCVTDTTNQQCIAALNEFVSLSSENALTVSQLENDIYDLLVTGLKQGVQAAIDSSDPASFTSRQANNEQPTLLLAAVGDCGDSCDVGVDYIPDSVVPNSAPDNIRTGTEPLIKALGLAPITGTTGQPLTTTETRGVIRTTTGGHGTYLFPYEGTMDESGLPGFPDSEELNFVWDATNTQQVAVASMVTTKGASIEIVNEDHIETEVPQNEE